MKRNIKFGFSLVEISITIIIIGIIIIGISKGIDLYQDFKTTNAKKLTLDSQVNRISNLALWLETTSEKSFQTKMSDNSPVNQWNNITPFNLDKKNALLYSTTAPLYTKNAINGLPAIKFDKNIGNCLSVENGFDDNSEDVTIFVVLSQFSETFQAASQGRILDRTGNTLDAPVPYRLYQSFSFSDYKRFYTYSWVEIEGKEIRKPYIVTARKQKLGKVTIWINGVKGQEVTDTLNFSLANSVPLYIGCNSSLTRNGDFFLGEVILFSKVLNDSELDSVNKYLSQKWGIKLN